MTRAALLAALLSLATACADATAPSAARYDEPFSLGVGELALLEPDPLLVGFEAVASDSRCPSDVNCVTAGDATVELWLRRPPAPRERRVLHTDPSLGDAAEYAGSRVWLLALEPLPRSDAPVPATSYRVTLVVR